MIKRAPSGFIAITLYSSGRRPKQERKRRLSCNTRDRHVAYAFVTIGTPVITNRTRHSYISSAQDVKVSGPVGYDRCSYCDIEYTQKCTQQDVHKKDKWSADPILFIYFLYLTPPCLRVTIKSQNTSRQTSICYTARLIHALDMDNHAGVAVCCL